MAGRYELPRKDSVRLRELYQRSNAKVLVAILFTCIIYYFRCFALCNKRDVVKYVTEPEKKDDVRTVYGYNLGSPLIFIGGVPGSGVTLLRVMLGAHSEVRCGAQTGLIPTILQRSRLFYRPEWPKKTPEERKQSVIIRSALGAMILEVMVRHDDVAPRLCNKDHFFLSYSPLLHWIFPKAKFLYMIRDGRATVQSIISNKLNLTGFVPKDYVYSFDTWNRQSKFFYERCEELGPEWCLKVHYEKLVINPEKEMRRILKFLDLSWDEKVLHHEREVGKPGGIHISEMEPSKDVIKPVHSEALYKWVAAYPKVVLDKLPSISPMLSVLGYDPNANPPDYSQLQKKE